MWNEPTKERLAKIPKLYETENVPLKDKLIHLKFFIGNCTWFIAEYDGHDLFWGFCHLGDDACAEWGYVSFKELKSIKIDRWMEIDCELEDFWQVKRAIEIDKIRIAQGWLKENNTPQNISKEDELVMKVKAGHFTDFQDLFSELTSPYSEFFGIDPYPIWENARK